MAEFETPGRVSLHVQNPEGYVEVVVHDEPRTVVDLLPLSETSQRSIDAARVDAQQRGDEHVVEIELPSKGRLSFRSSPVGVRVFVPGGELAERRLGVGGRHGPRHPAGGRRAHRVGRRAPRRRGRRGQRAHRERRHLARPDRRQGPARDRLRRRRGGRRRRRAQHPLGVAATSPPRAPPRSVQANSVSGDIRLETVERGDVKVQSVSGDVMVGVKEGVRLWIDAQSLSGDMDSELPVSDGPTGDGDAGARAADQDGQRRPAAGARPRLRADQPEAAGSGGN